MKERKEINIQIGERIQKARELSGYTQEKLADKVDVSTQYISDLERGIVGTSVLTLIKICNTLCVSSDYILMGEKENNDISDVINRLRHLPQNEVKIVENSINLMIEAFQSREKKQLTFSLCSFRVFYPRVYSIFESCIFINNKTILLLSFSNIIILISFTCFYSLIRFLRRILLLPFFSLQITVIYSL